MKIQEVIDGIIEKTGVQLSPEQTCDHVMCGDPNREVTKIVTTFMATVEVIKKAIKIGANFIITHEPTWYTGHDTTGWLENDEVYAAKRKLIEDHQITIWRFHDHMHMSVDEDGIYRGFERKMDWKKYRIPYQGNEQEFGGSYEIPETTLENLSKEFREKIGIEVIQFVGNRDVTVRRVGVYVGGGSLGLGIEERPMQHMRELDIDVAVCGDITEWTLSAYINDAKALGMNKAMLVLGHERSEEMGMEYLGEWLKDITGEIEIIFIDAKEPFDYFVCP
ncbi:hypothetical protein E5329_19310 [Petralouisia muris]|uniref:Uncharacterized protein n=1 Tax=Petralouisia muris TaxID=3032872 RepID=A0AC61RS03_9FIRM|nr:Nif3-like dinuclear metal center hexameric protein [Petralouisia muris]TGY92605.1 hypothetical protein E5329_19310 [Petralouisia muris]